MKGDTSPSPRDDKESIDARCGWERSKLWPLPLFKEHVGLVNPGGAPTLREQPRSTVVSPNPKEAAFNDDEEGSATQDGFGGWLVHDDEKKLPPCW